MIKIKPIQLGLPQKEANEILIRPIFQDTRATSCNTYYEVSSVTTTVDENEIEIKTREILANGNCPISEEEYALWGIDDSYIEDIVLNFLGLDREL